MTSQIIFEKEEIENVLSVGILKNNLVTLKDTRMKDLGTDPIHQNNLELAKKGAKQPLWAKKNIKEKSCNRSSTARILV